MPETTPLIKAALNLRGGAGFDVYFQSVHHVSFILSYTVLYDFVSLAFSLTRVHKH